MASSIYRKKHGGTVKIHDKAVVDHVVGDSENAKAEIENKCTAYKDMFDKESSKFSTKSEFINECLPKVESKRSMTGQSRNSRSSSNLQDQSLKLQNWIDKKTIKELQERADTESLETKKLYSELMETEQTFVKKLDELLSHKDLVDLRRKELLYLQWSEEVYEPIRKKILQAIDGSEWSKLDRRKRELHKQFLEHVNKRGHVFLEDDDKEQYYAQALNDSRPAPIKIKTEALRDPLLTLGRKKAEEERTILRCMTGQHYTDEDIEKVKLPPLPLVPLGRHGVNSRKWLQMPLNNIESEIRQRRRQNQQQQKGEMLKGIECLESTQNQSLTSAHGHWQNLMQRLLNKNFKSQRNEYLQKSPLMGNHQPKYRKHPLLTRRNLQTKSSTQIHFQRT
ncbi:protein FAM228B-like isoform X2 [Physella acuta]|uniref:protein FAM228B-like isoform X2 n=1 Tax=Physella acuta TaxID=109671 RepID=UPI0027DD6BC1|nr:protein FAM228B-like isoform X2 [Physella acuta]